MFRWHHSQPIKQAEARAMSDHNSESIQQEVDRNYEAFVKMLPAILPTHRDKYALMKGGEIISYFSTAEDARTAGEKFIPDKVFSIQQVSDAALNYGFYTDAVVIH
jgi:hypothetical protein